MNQSINNAPDNKPEVLVTDFDDTETLYENEEEYEAAQAIGEVFEEDDEVIEED